MELQFLKGSLFSGAFGGSGGLGLSNELNSPWNLVSQVDLGCPMDEIDLVDLVDQVDFMA